MLVQTEGDLQVANVVESEVVQNPAAPERGRSWAQVVYRRGDFVGLSPNKKAHKLHTDPEKFDILNCWQMLYTYTSGCQRLLGLGSG